MLLLVTGGTGFVMSHVLLNWLHQNPDGTAVSIDIAPPDGVAERFFAPVHDRLELITGDVLDPDLLGTVSNPSTITHIVCGAAMTPTRGTTENSLAAKIAGVNLMGPVHCLEFARTLPGLERMVHVSTGSVYRDDGPADVSPLPEDGFMRQPIKAPSEGYQVHVEEFDAMREYGGLWVSVWHPFVSGRLARATQIERLIRHMQDKGGVWFARLDEIADHVNGLVERGEWAPRRHTLPFWTHADT